MKTVIFSQLAGPLGRLVGRHNLVRAGEYLSRAGRRDMPNRLSTNGEKLLQQVVLSHLREKPAVVVDCGANLGLWSKQLVQLSNELGRATASEVYCFEPSSYTFSKLRQTLDTTLSCFACVPVQAALSSHAGTMELKLVAAGAGTNSLVGVPGKFSDVETVEATTLTNFARERHISHIDLLKIDAEGHDFDVLSGATDLLRERRIGVIQFEYNWRWIYGRHYLYDAFQLLQQYGYHVGKLTHLGVEMYERYDVRLESFIEGNYVACTDPWQRLLPLHKPWLK